jgi:hypothetical protein
MRLRLACVLSGLGVALAKALLFSTGHAAHAVCGAILFALEAAGVELQGWVCGAILFALGPRASGRKAGTRPSGYGAAGRGRTVGVRQRAGR